MAKTRLTESKQTDELGEMRGKISLRPVFKPRKGPLRGRTLTASRDFDGF